MSRQVERQSQALHVQVVSLTRRSDFWLSLAGLAVVGVLGWYYSAPLMEWLTPRGQTRSWIESYGHWAPLAYISLYVTQIVAAPVPGNFMGILAGWLFGIFWGAVYSVAALTIGIAIAIGLSRIFGRPLLERFVSETTLNKWEVKLKIRSPLLWGIVFMFPVPDALIYMAGLSSIPFRWLLPAIVLGRSAGIIFANMIGGWSAKLPPRLLAVQWSVILVAVALLYWYQRRLKLYALLGYRRLRRLLNGWQQDVKTTNNTRSASASAREQRSGRGRLSQIDIDETG